MNDDLSHYEVDIDLANPNTSHSQIVDLVGFGRQVLDIGCWTGGLGRVLQSRGCTVSGLEIDEAAAARAREHLTQVVVANLDASPASSHFAAHSFDVVVMGDVLEHLHDPVGALRDVENLLAPGGQVVISVPNITHGSVRLALLQGRWRYTDTGLLDATHIRFFNRQGMFDLFRAAGFVVDELRAPVADPLVVEVQVDADRLPVGVVEWVRHQPDALVYQFVASAHPAQSEDELTAAVPPLVPAAPEENVRAIDKYTAASEREIEARHRQLTVRDHIIGLEAAVATAQTRADRAEVQLQSARKRLEKKNDRIKALSEQVVALTREVGDRRGAADTVRSAVHRLRSGPGPRT